MTSGHIFVLPESHIKLGREALHGYVVSIEEERLEAKPGIVLAEETVSVGLHKRYECLSLGLRGKPRRIVEDFEYADLVVRIRRSHKTYPSNERRREFLLCLAVEARQQRRISKQPDFNAT